MLYKEIFPGLIPNYCNILCDTYIDYKSDDLLTELNLLEFYKYNLSDSIIYFIML